MSMLLPEYTYKAQLSAFCDIGAGHLDQCWSERAWTCRAVMHLTLGIAEMLVPIIGQIITLFEMLLAWIYYSYPIQTVSVMHMSGNLVQVPLEKSSLSSYEVIFRVPFDEDAIGTPRGEMRISRIMTDAGESIYLHGIDVVFQNDNNLNTFMETMFQIALEWGNLEGRNCNCRVIMGPMPRLREPYQHLGLQPYTPSEIDREVAREHASPNRQGSTWAHLPLEEATRWAARIQAHRILT